MTEVHETEGSAQRRQLWRAAGMPSADIRRLEYAGADSVRWGIERTLPRFPPEVAWFAVEGIHWIEVGRTCLAWAHYQPEPRALPGDIGHRIAVMGTVPDELLPGLLAHEISHRWRKPVRAVVPGPMPLAEVDMLAARVCAQACILDENQQLLARAYWISAHVAEEIRADDQVRAWGFAWRGHDRDELCRRFAETYREATRLATLAAQLDDANIAACTEVTP